VRRAAAVDSPRILISCQSREAASQLTIGRVILIIFPNPAAHSDCWKREFSEMTSMRHEDLFARFNGNAPANLASISRCQANLGFPLPADYTRFLRQMNGGEGFLGENAYLALWRAEGLAEMNAGYKVPEAPPELLLFGSSGAGEAFAFDTRTAPPLIVVVPFVGLDWSDAIVIARRTNIVIDWPSGQTNGSASGTRLSESSRRR
jgi:hypothetical protein